MNTHAEGSARWSAAHRIGFRFVFVYVLLYLTTFPVNMLPFGFRLGDVRVPVWDGLVPAAARSWFGATVEPVAFGAGGDLVFNYVQALCCAAIAAVGALAWTILDRKRAAYPRLAGVLRVVVRYALAMTMLMYGFQKVFLVQFRPPSEVRLLQPYGDSSPSGLLWTFMGFSPAYTIFGGTMEVLGAVLLLWRRTATLGALVLCGVLANVVMLNFCYDVGVKLFSLHLFAMAGLLAAPELRRLADVLVLNRPVAPRARAGVSGWRRVVATVIGLAVGVGAVAGSAWENYGISAAGHGVAGASPLDGVYWVERVEAGDAESAGREADRWQRVTIEWGTASVHLADGRLESYSMDSDTGGTMWSWSPPGTEAKSWMYTRPEPGVLVVKGRVGDGATSMVLRKQERPGFLLTSRGFNWVGDETYFNR